MNGQLSVIKLLMSLKKIDGGPNIVLPAGKRQRIYFGYRRKFTFRRRSFIASTNGGHKRVITFASRMLYKVEKKKYCVSRRELHMVFYFTKYFRHHWRGGPFILRADNGSLQWIYKFKDPDGHVIRWIQHVSSFEFQIIHYPGRSFVMPMIYQDWM